MPLTILVRTGTCVTVSSGCSCWRVSAVDLHGQEVINRTASDQLCCVRCKGLLLRHRIDGAVFRSVLGEGGAAQKNLALTAGVW